jgi:hypothetical protein
VDIFFSPTALRGVSAATSASNASTSFGAFDDGNTRSNATGFHASGHPGPRARTTLASATGGIAAPAAAARATPSPPLAPGMPTSVGGARATRWQVSAARGGTAGRCRRRGRLFVFRLSLSTRGRLMRAIPRDEGSDVGVEFERRQVALKCGRRGAGGIESEGPWAERHAGQSR